MAQLASSSWHARHSRRHRTGDAVDWTRCHYSPRAVETPWQRNWVETFPVPPVLRILILIGDSMPGWSVARMSEYHSCGPALECALIGVNRVRQGRGYGSALLGDGRKACDAQAVPVDHESTSEPDKRLYERHGFETIGVIGVRWLAADLADVAQAALSRTQILGGTNV